jgi:hypothetical protein
VKVREIGREFDAIHVSSDFTIDFPRRCAEDSEELRIEVNLGDWLIFQDGRPVRALSHETFRNYYAPVEEKK